MIRQIWLWILVGVGIGAFIYNYIPEESLHSLMQATGIFSVPLATLLGIPMYGSCAAIVPVAVVLFQKGIPWELPCFYDGNGGPQPPRSHHATPHHAT